MNNKLHLTTGDYIENSKGMDAIVNAANEYMIAGSGICGVIYQAAGLELVEYCKNNYATNMKTGEVRVTPGFNLGMDILHVLAPKAYESNNPLEDILQAYKKLLKTIEENKYNKVLLCSIGTGVHGYNHYDISKPVIELLYEFCKTHNIDIYFNSMYPLHKDIYLKELLKLKNINLKQVLLQLEPKQILEYLNNNALSEDNIKYKYRNFVKGKPLEDLSLSEILICLQYTIENFDVDKEQLFDLINAIKE